MARSRIALTLEPDQPVDVVLLTWQSAGRSSVLVSIRRPDIDDFSKQLLPPKDQNALIERNLKTLTPVVARKVDRRLVMERANPRTRRITRLIELTREDLEQGLRRYVVSSRTPLPIENGAGFNPPAGEAGTMIGTAPVSAGDGGYMPIEGDPTGGFAPDPLGIDEVVSPPEPQFAFDISGAGFDQGIWASLPVLPAQGPGPHFEITKDGVIDFVPPEMLDRDGNNVDRLRRLHPPLRDLARHLAEALAAGNAPHSTLRARLEEYRKKIDQPLDGVDFTLLYVEGVRLANAETAAREQISKGELPPLEEIAREQIDTLLDLHGAFILSTLAGAELIAAEERYQRRPAQEREYQAAAIDFATSLQNQPAIIAPDAAAFVLGAAEQISQGANPERSGIVGTSTLQNVVIVLAAGAVVAALPIAGGVLLSTGGAIAGGLGGLVVGDGLRKSKPFATVVAPIIAKLDQAAEIDFAKYKPFLLSIEQQTRRLIRRRKQFEWLGKALDWAKNSTAKKSNSKTKIVRRAQLADMLLHEARMDGKCSDLDRIVIVAHPDGSWLYQVVTKTAPPLPMDCERTIRNIAIRLAAKYRVFPYSPS